MIHYNKLKRLESDLYVAKTALHREKLENKRLLSDIDQFFLVVKLLGFICAVAIVGILLSQ